MTKEEALQVLDGSLLGDGSLRRLKSGALYHMDLSKHTILIGDHLKYLCWIANNALEPLGVVPCKSYPKLGTTASRGKPYRYARLATHVSPVLGQLYDEWYIGGSWKEGFIHGATKVIPRRLMQAKVLPVLSLVPWFLEDSGSYHAIGSTKVRVAFAVCNFTEEEVSHLTTMLNNMGLNTVKPAKENVKKGSGLSIYLAQDSINPLMNLVEPLILDVFGDSRGSSYKDAVKRRPMRKKLGGK